MGGMEEILNLKFAWTILHLIGVAVGLGGALFGDFLFFKATKNGIVSATEFRTLHTASHFLVVGLVLLCISGAGLFSLDSAKYLASTKFLSKMAIVAVIAINGIIFHRHHFKTLRQLIGVSLRHSALFRRESVGIFISGGISVTSWLFALALGSLQALPYSILQILSVYLVVLVVGISAALVLRVRFLAHK